MRYNPIECIDYSDVRSYRWQLEWEISKSLVARLAERKIGARYCQRLRVNCAHLNFLNARQEMVLL